MLKLYKDRKQTFECKIKIENAKLNNARARLMLSGPQMDFAFIGKVDAMGNCMVEIPPLRMMEHKEGAAILEVMVDGGYFEPLKTDYKLVSREVTVENVVLTDESYTVKVEAEKVTKEPTKKPLKENSYKFLKAEANENDKKIIKGILEGYKRLDKKNKNILKEHIESNYKPSKKTFDWAKKVFKNPNSTSANMIMYKIDNL
jgi:hypothetical protein